jgi:predicted nucleic acid-binding protein
MTGWLADTSVAVPAIIENHAAHASVAAWLSGRPVVLAMHSALETYSVLTRLPGDARLAPIDASSVIAELFGDPVPLPGRRARRLVHELASLGIAAGAVYDALIAVTADVAGRTLVTRDHRAAATYSVLNVPHEFVLS